ncbi:MAG: hypothetical protein CMJ83_00520 [Planctomycetes bacterium]|nr:hypothetical protein [Planctomycetota bacterium]
MNGGTSFERKLGEYTTGRDGPTIVVTGGVHGNEPFGAHAVREVLATLEQRQAPLRGRLIGVAGNLGGLAANQRYLDRDLNRRWHFDDLLAMTTNPKTREDREQVALLRTFREIMAGADGPVVFLDLHSTSGEGAPFAAMADVLRNRPVAFALPLPVVLGLEEAINGTMLGYLCDLGHVGVAVEGGQHEDPETGRHHVAMVWITLVSAGALSASDVPDLEDRRQRLADAAGNVPRILEIRHRHAVVDGDGFEMRAGFANFSPVAARQPVAGDASGPIYAPERGLMMLPRYQRTGDDGYFLARPVSRFWLRVSAIARHMGLHRLLWLLPGIDRHPELDDHLIARRKVARAAAPDVFHLLGYRRLRWMEDADRMVFTRRRPDHLGATGFPPELDAALRHSPGGGS